MNPRQPTLVPAALAPDFDSFAVRQAIVGFLAGYLDTTRNAYTVDLRQWLGWCTSHDLRVFAVKRADIELFARSLEQDGKVRATVARRLSTNAGFYRYCVEDQLIPVSLAVHLRRPKLDYASNATGLDRNELGVFLVQAGLAGGRDHGLACLLALNGLRISEALNADIEHLGLERGAPDADDHPQGRQDRHHPPCSPDRRVGGRIHDFNLFRT
jgi:site-specific recombinase XerD